MAKTTEKTPRSKSATKNPEKTPPIIVVDNSTSGETPKAAPNETKAFYNKLLDIGLEESFAEKISAKNFEKADEKHVLNLFNSCIKAGELFTADELSKITHMLKSPEVASRATGVKVLIKASDPDFNVKILPSGLIIMASIACKIIYGGDTNNDISKARSEFMKNKKPTTDAHASEKEFSKITKDILNLPKEQQKALLMLLQNILK